MENTIPKVPFLHLFKTETGVVGHCLISKKRRPIFAHDADRRRDGVDDFTQISFARLQGLFRLFAVLDICEEQIPRRYLVFRITHRESTDLEPSVDAISAETTMLNLVELS